MAVAAAGGDDARAADCYLRQPSLRGDLLCFLAGGDLWLWRGPDWRQGRALRLTALGSCRRPLLSPDGGKVAFASSHLGSAQEVFLLPTTGTAPPLRLTYFGAPDATPAAWSQDGSSVLVSSSCRQPLGYPALFLVPAGGATGAAAAVPFPYGCCGCEQVSFAAGSGRALVGRRTLDSHLALWKGYIGGQLGSIWVQEDGATPGRLQRLELSVRVEEEGLGERCVPLNASCPGWSGDRIFFVSDVDGCGNLWSCCADGGHPEQHTFHKGLYARNLAVDASSGDMVYERGGELWLFARAAGRAARLPAPGSVGTALAASAELQPQALDAAQWLDGARVHPDGHHLLAFARGRVFELALWEGPAVELRPAPAAARQGGAPAPFARCLAACYTTTGSVLALREAPQPPPGCDGGPWLQLELHPPNPYTPAEVLEGQPLWLAGPEDSPSAGQLGGGLASCQLSAPVPALLPPELGEVRGLWASPVDEGLVVVTNQLLELHLIRLGVHCKGGSRALGIEERHLLARSSFGPGGVADVAWSHAGRWLAFASQAAPGAQAPSAIWLCDVSSSPPGSPVRVTDGCFRDFSPSFDPAGGFLAFLSRRALQPVDDGITSAMHFGAGSDQPLIVSLVDGAPSPLERPPRAPGEAAAGGGGRAEDGGPEGAGRGLELAEAVLASVVGRAQVAPAGPLAPPEAVPVAAGRYLRLASVERGLLYLREASGAGEGHGASLFLFDLDRRRERTVASGVADFEVSLDLRNVLVRHASARVRVLSLEEARSGGAAEADAGEEEGEEDDEEEDPEGDETPEDRGLVAIGARINLEVQPLEEWAQMFHEAWRLLRDRFFDGGMCGSDWAAVRGRYAALLGRLACRDDLTDLLLEMAGELGVARVHHLPPLAPYRPESCAMGLLGAEVEWDAAVAGYSVSRLVVGDPWDCGSGGALCGAAPGVAEGARLLAVNRQRLTEARGLEQLLGDRENHEVFVTLVDAENADRVAAHLRQGASQGEASGAGKDSQPAPSKNSKKKEKKKAKKQASGVQSLVRTVRVRCSGYEAERRARYRDWVESNRRAVSAASGGRVGYLHLPDCGPAGLAEFHRHFVVECLCEAVVVDLRGNPGGDALEELMDSLLRVPLGVIVPRRGRGQVATYPSCCMRNKQTTVLLVDGASGGEAEILAAAFKSLGRGSLVGTRTMGGVAASGDVQVPLLDGSSLSLPTERLWSLSERGREVENWGVLPDVEAEVPPDWAPLDGGQPDPQLAAAVREAARLAAERGTDVAALLRRCRQFPRTREHTGWKVLTPAGDGRAQTA